MSDMSSEHVAHVKQLLEKAAAGDGLVKHMNSVYSILRQAGLMSGPTQIHSRWVGCHSSNRDGLGINPDHCWDLLSDISDLGWLSSEACGIVVELSKHDTSVREFNLRMAESMASLECFSPNVFPILSCSKFVSNAF